MYWTTELNKCLDFVAPWKKRKVKQKRHSLPKEILVHVKKQKDLQKIHQTNMKNGEVGRKKSRFKILGFIFQQAAKKRDTES